MSEPKFKIRERVRISENPERPNEEPGFGSSLNQFKGEVLTVISIKGGDSGFLYTMNNYGSCIFAERWLEPATLKFGIGQRVKVSENPERLNNGPYFNQNSKGKIGIVKEISNYRVWYKLEGMEGMEFDERWLELVEPKYKNGERAKVVENPAVKEWAVWHSFMDKFKGKIVVIETSEFSEKTREWSYKTVEGFVFADDWLKPLSPEEIAAVEKLSCDPKNLLAVCQGILKEFKSYAKQDKTAVFVPKNLQAGEGSYDYKIEVRNIEIEEGLRLLGATFYHFIAGRSEYNHESFLLDGYRRPLESPFWPGIEALLKKEVWSAEKAEEIFASLNPADLEQPSVAGKKYELPSVVVLAKPKSAGDVIRELMGEKIKIISHEEVAKLWSVAAPKDIRIRYSEETLKEVIKANKWGEDWRLCYYSGQSLRQMREKLGTDNSSQPCFYNNDYWLDSRQDYWANIGVESGYYLLNFKGKFDGENWDVQERLISELGPVYERCHENIVVEAILSNYRVNNGERLLEDWCHLGKELDSARFRVKVGYFKVKRGFGVYDIAPVKPEFVRVVILKKFDF